MSGTVFRLPDLGEGLTEAEVLEWKVSVGDVVTVDQVVVEVETAKAAVDVPVPMAGTVAELHAEAGSVVTVGAPLISVTAAGSAPHTGSASHTGSGPDTGSEPHNGAAERYREEERAGSGNVLVGYGTAATTTRRSRRLAAPSSGETPRVISPVVRRLAKDHGIDVAALTPSGPGGVVLRKDVEDAIAAAARPEEPEAGEVRVPLKGVRRTMADRVSRSRREIPDATTWVDADATRLVKLKKKIQRADPGARVGMLALFARICVAGLRRFPELNAYVDDERQEIVRLPGVNLGFAAQTDRGLVVPVVRDAQRLTLAELGAELARLTGEAREGRLSPDDLTGGTFTLNNYGVFGVDGSTPIINHPEAAMLGVGRVTEKPWVWKGKVRPRQVTQLSFTFDHRVCDGAVAGGFLRFVADCTEHPETLLTNL
ncbi:2-oxo acid dehydrogenase subunit E2 [Actinomadura sp. KC216]|uniref:dihydrolipoamide acetyltransferase family protein n=1 Tax=Actinomadura sp. KC216 TaxID=2530370 RepID=UPI0010437739|nr:dihydrolipoamide acetyltransferase family protein [Actinomadura sp. KC216]TDB91579.1 2-oxo acid dehydrogenase subunit E2 [Actinomadura sp. KC216]